MTDEKYTICPICNSPAIIHELPNNEDGNYVICYRCGHYDIVRSALKKSINELEIANISGWIRENQGEMIASNEIESLKKLTTPTVSEKATKLLKYIAKEKPIPGKYIQIDFQTLFNVQNMNSETQYPQKVFDDLKKYLPFLSITWSIEGHDLRYLIEDYLIKEKNYLTGNKKYKITPKGWAYLDSLKYHDVDSQIAFIAMWFDESMDGLLNSIESSILEAGYEPKRVDKHEHINKIDDEIIALIRQSKFIVADYTDQRGGVYFESGFALGINIPVVWTCRKDEIKKLHFDTNHYNFLTWEKDTLPEFEDKLKNRILAIIGEGSYNPE